MPALLEVCEPASQEDLDALADLVDAPTPADWLESDYLGAILTDLEA